MSDCQKEGAGKLPQYNQDVLDKRLLNTGKLPWMLSTSILPLNSRLDRGIWPVPQADTEKSPGNSTSSPLTKVYRYFLPCFNQSEKKSFSKEYLQNKGEGNIILHIQRKIIADGEITSYKK